jgi:hypothetical protein
VDIKASSLRPSLPKILLFTVAGWRFFAVFLGNTLLALRLVGPSKNPAALRAHRFPQLQ